MAANSEVASWMMENAMGKSAATCVIICTFLSMMRAGTLFDPLALNEIEGMDRKRCFSLASISEAGSEGHAMQRSFSLVKPLRHSYSINIVIILRASPSLPSAVEDSFGHWGGKSM